MAEEELDLIQFAACKWHSRAHVRRRSCGASLSMPARAAAARTTSHSTLGDMPSPQTPGLVDCAEHRTVRDVGRSCPAVDVILHPRGDGNRSHVSALANEISNDPVLLALLNRLELQRQQYRRSFLQ